VLLYFSPFLFSCLKFGPEKTLSSNLSRFRPRKPVCEPVFVDRFPRTASYFPELSPSGFWRNSGNKTNIFVQISHKTRHFCMRFGSLEMSMARGACNRSLAMESDMDTKKLSITGKGLTTDHLKYLSSPI